MPISLGQVVSGCFFVDPPGFVDRLNANLPDQIRFIGYKRVNWSFSSKKLCDRRRYVYLIHVFALDPITHRDREAVMASALRIDVKSEALSFSLLDVDVARIQEDGCRIENAEKKINGACEANSKFSYDDKEKERFNRILSYYVGSYNFHNFTTRMKPDDPAANRSIISFTEPEPVLVSKQNDENSQVKPSKETITLA